MVDPDGPGCVCLCHDDLDLNKETDKETAGYSETKHQAVTLEGQWFGTMTDHFFSMLGPSMSHEMLRFEGRSNSTEMRMKDRYLLP